jgi:hypothetical protein
MLSVSVEASPLVGSSRNSAVGTLKTNRRGGWDAREALHDAERVGGGEPAGGFVEKQRGGDPQNESTWGLGRTRGSARC